MEIDITEKALSFSGALRKFNLGGKYAVAAILIRRGQRGQEERLACL